MTGFIKLFKTTSRAGKPMLSSIARRETAVGVAFEGRLQGEEQVTPWYIMITKVHPDTIDDVMWYNPDTEKLLSNSEYQELAQSEPTGDSVDESTGEVLD